MEPANSIYIEKGEKVGVLLIHGFTSNPRQFKELSSYLVSNGYTVLAPVIAGHGTTPNDLSVTTSEDWKKTVIDAYKMIKSKVSKVVIIGNSFGSNLAFWLAKETNNSPSGIIALGAPIYLRYQGFIKFRLATYGRFKRFYKKPGRIFKADYTDMADTSSYDVIPIKSLGEFFGFIKNETIPGLSHITTPVLIANASVDPVIHPRSAQFIYGNIGSKKKEMYIFESNMHGIAAEKPCPGLFPKILSFIKETTND